MALPIRALFQQALELPPDKREVWINEACGGDAALAAELCALLDADAAGSGILDISLESVAHALQLSTSDEFADRVGTKVGPYRLIALVGRGGMGVVYRAERDVGDFSQTVALKLIREEKLCGYARERFLQERNILARMQHPNIAHLIDGGVGIDEQPWFAMEYVDGEPLLQWCDNQRLSVRARLAVMLDICGAVEYAHSHLVIHRDIKPSNVMVSANKTVKLLDFGIAKLLEGNESQRLSTGEHMRLLTLEYATPEQIRGAQVTTATDVHALGLLLYELLCGRRAFARNGTTAFEVQREIIESDPPTMLARVKADAAAGESTLELLAERRQSDGTRLLRALRGDLQHIVAKALRKEPQQRYVTVAAFAEDIRRYLVDKPVTAAGGARWYRLRTFVRRNRLAVGLVGVVIFSLVAGLAAVLWQAARTREETKSALAARDFLVDVFKSANPFQTKGRVVSAVDLIDSGVQRAEIELQNQPKLQAYLFEALGTSYLTLGHRKKAKAILMKGLEAAQAVDGESLQAQQISLDFAEILIVENPASKELGGLLDRVVEAQKHLPVRNRPLLVRALLARGFNQFAVANYAGALTTMHDALSESEEHSVENELERTFALEGLATVLAGMRRDVEAVATYRDVLKTRERLFGVHSPPAARTQSVMSLPLVRIGAGAEAEELARYAAASMRDTFGESSPDYGDVLQRLGNVLTHNGKLPEAEDVLEKSLAIAKGQGEETSGLALAYNYLSQLKCVQGQYAFAEAYANQALNIHQKLDADGMYAGMAMNTLGISLFEQGKFREAEKIFLELSELQQRNNWQFVVPTMDYLGRLRRVSGHPDEALLLHERAIQTGIAQSGDSGEDALLAKVELAKDERDLGQMDRARREIEATLPALMRIFSADHPTNLEARYLQEQLNVVEGRCTDQSLRIFDTLRHLYRKTTDDGGWKVDERDLLASLCRAQLYPASSKREEIQFARIASALMNSPRAEPYAKRLAADAIQRFHTR